MTGFSGSTSPPDPDAPQLLATQHQDGVTVYPIYPTRSPNTFLLALAVVAGFLSLVAVPVGWWLGGGIGALTGVALSVAIFVLADGMTEREIHTFPMGSSNSAHGGDGSGRPVRTFWRLSAFWITMKGIGRST